MSDKCAHGIKYEHPTEYCEDCLREALRSEGPSSLIAQQAKKKALASFLGKQFKDRTECDKLCDELAAARAVVEAARKLGAGFTDDVGWLKAMRKAIRAYDKVRGKEAEK